MTTTLTTSFTSLYTWASGDLALTASGSVTDTSGTGIEATSTVDGSLTNAGLISGAGWGAVSIDDRAVVTNLTNTSAITGQAWGIAVQFGGAIGTLDNSGTVTSAGFEAISNNGTISEIINSGTLSGGIYENGGMSSTIGSILNTGTITADAGGQAIDLSNNLSASVMLSNSGTITGQILLSPNADILTILGGSISGDIVASAAGHGTVDIAVGAGHTYDATGKFGGQTALQTTAAAALAAVTLESGTLAIAAADLNTDLITFAGAHTGLILRGLSSSGLAAPIAGFAAGDTIDLAGITATAASVNGGNQLVVTDNGVTVAELQLTQNYSGLAWTVAGDGNGGSEISVGGSPSGTVPVYGISRDAQNAVTEGGTETFTVTTHGVAAGTVLYYTLSGVTAAQVAGGHLTGTVTVGGDGTASLPVSLTGTLGSGLSGSLTATLSASASGPGLASASVGLIETTSSAMSLNTSYAGLYTWTSGNLALTANGSVNNPSGIGTSGTGIEATSTVDGSLTNAGLIDGAGWGAVSIDSGAVVTDLTNTGVITGHDWGIAVQFGGSIGILDNSGTVTGGGIEAISNNGTILKIVNSGTLSGGIFENGGQSSTIGSILNTGTITADAGGQAIDLSNNLSASVMLSNSGTITGQIKLSPNADILTILGGSISGDIIASAAGHGTVDIAVGAGQTYTATGKFGGQTALQTTATAALAAVTLESGTLAISAANLNTDLITFAGAHTGLALSGLASSGLSAPITGFAAGDTIDLTGVAATSASVNGGNQLVVTDNGVTVAEFQLLQDYSGLAWTVSSDGNGGSELSVNGSPGGAVPTYGISRDTQKAVTEGGTETFTITTHDVAPGTVLYYALSGVTTFQVAGGHLTGTVTVGSDGTASLPVSLTGTLGSGLSGSLTATLSASAGGPALTSASVALSETMSSSTSLNTSHNGLYSWTSGNLALTSSGSVTNTSGTGIEATSTVEGNLTNAGVIKGAGWGAVSIDGSAAVANFTNTGMITGQVWGIAVQFGGSIGTLDNSGTVTGAGFEALSNNGAIGKIVNSGTLSGGIFENGGMSSTIGSLLNTGTITADEGGQAIDLSNNLSASVMLSNSGTITGQILLSPNADILTILGGSISGDIVASAAGHGTVDIAVGAGHTYTATDAFGGELLYQTTAKALAAVTLESGTLAISAANLNAETVTFVGAYTGLALSGLSSGLTATIAGFAVGDTIDLTGVAATAAGVNDSDQLVINNGTKVVATLQLSGDYSGLSFTLSSDGKGGTAIGLQQIVAGAQQSVAEALTNFQAGHLSSSVTITDSAANVAGNLDALQSLAASSGNAITLTGSGTPTLQVTAAQLVSDLAVLKDISGSFSLSVDASAPDITISGLANHALTATFTGEASQYGITSAGDGIHFTLTGAGSVDHLSGVTALQFSDYTEIVASQTAVAGSPVSSAQITELYAAVFGRAPDVAGLAYYQNIAATNPTIPLTQFAQWFLNSPEYQGNAAHDYAQTSAGETQFIADCYINLLHRTASADETGYYLNVIKQFTTGLTAGTSAYANADALAHAYVVTYFSQSPEFLAGVTVTAQNPAGPQHWLVLI